MKDRGWFSDEHGHSLFELSMSMPIMIMLTLALGTMFLWTMKFFIYEMADWELQEEMYSAVNRVAKDARAAGSIRIKFKEIDFFKDYMQYCSIMILKNECYPETHRTVIYYSAEQPELAWKIYRHSEFEPITGDSIFSNVRLMRFRCEIIPPARLRIEAKAWSRITSHRLEAKTEIFLPELLKNDDTNAEYSGL